MQGLTIRARVREVNKIIGVISEHGPRFLYSAAHGRRARFGLDRYLQTWYVDHQTGLIVYPFGEDRWLGFTGPRELVAMLAHFAKDDTPLDLDKLLALLVSYSDEDKALVRGAVESMVAPA